MTAVSVKKPTERIASFDDRLTALMYFRTLWHTAGQNLGPLNESFVTYAAKDLKIV